MQAERVVRLIKRRPDTAAQMLNLAQSEHLRRQHIQRVGAVLQSLADVFDNQHIFSLVFIVFH